MKKLLNVSFSKIYVIGVILISVLLVGGYFSYAVFTVSKERSNAISIVTGNLIYDLKVDGDDIESLVVPANTTIEFIVTLTNPNNRIARFNFYYLDELPSEISAGYVVEENMNIPPVEQGINLEKEGTSGSSNTYKIKVTNPIDSSITINLGVSVGLDYNDLSLPSDGHLFEEYKVNLSDIVLTNEGLNGHYFDDGIDTFITGTDPNNYIWYSGKLWRAVLVNNEEKTTKLVTQWNISTINYSSGNANFKDSYIEEWLNDTTVDGFLGNLRDPEDFIVMDAKWNVTIDSTELGNVVRPSDEKTVNKAVGLLNMYEYQTSYRNTTYSNGYLNNGLYWWTLTSYSEYMPRFVGHDGNSTTSSPSNNSRGIRPTIYMKSNVEVVSGDGTINNPYRLSGDNDINLSGTLLNTRYSGEYIKFGNDENNLYQIVSHETKGLTKITSAEPLKDSEAFKTSAFGNTSLFSINNIISTFLNNDYLKKYVGDKYSQMIEDNTIWYLGTVENGSYKLAKYNDATGNNITSTITTDKVGLLRYGELMASQSERYAEKDTALITNLTTSYWTLNPYSSQYVYAISAYNSAYAYELSDEIGIRPALNLKHNVIITSGTGTKSDPFTIELNS